MLGWYRWVDGSGADELSLCPRRVPILGGGEHESVEVNVIADSYLVQRLAVAEDVGLRPEAIAA